jgi:hypothetical protein
VTVRRGVPHATCVMRKPKVFDKRLSIEHAARMTCQARALNGKTPESRVVHGRGARAAPGRKSAFATFCHRSWKTAPQYATVSDAAKRNAEDNDDSRCRAVIVFGFEACRSIDTGSGRDLVAPHGACLVGIAFAGRSSARRGRTPQKGSLLNSRTSVIKRPPLPPCPHCHRLTGVEEEEQSGSSLRWFVCRLCAHVWSSSPRPPH